MRLNRSRRMAVLALVVALSLWSTALGALAAPRAVSIKDFTYVPNMIRVNVGDTITWTNNDFAPHSATADNGTWDTGVMNAGTPGKTLTFATVGTFGYHCSIHGTAMIGTVIVGTAETPVPVPPGPPTAPPPTTAPPPPATAAPTPAPPTPPPATAAPAPTAPPTPAPTPSPTSTPAPTPSPPPAPSPSPTAIAAASPSPSALVAAAPSPASAAGSGPGPILAGAAIAAALGLGGLAAYLLRRRAA